MVDLVDLVDDDAGMPHVLLALAFQRYQVLELFF